MMRLFCHPLCRGVNCARFPQHPCSLQAIADVHAALSQPERPLLTWRPAWRLLTWRLGSTASSRHSVWTRVGSQAVDSPCS